MEIGKGRYKASLRGLGRWHDKNIKQGKCRLYLAWDILKELEWLNGSDMLIDIVKMGTENGIYIRKDVKDG